jgi:hypothetical protein
MSVALEVTLAVFVALVVVVVLLRVRKLRRDDMRKIAARVDRRLMVPPPSPYTPSKGFRLLDGPVNSDIRPDPPRPRLEPDRDYVFSESQLPPTYQESVSPLGRHDERWALSKSVQRSQFSSAGPRVALIAIVVVVVAVVALYYAQRANKPSAPTTTTTLAGSTQSKGRVDWPTTLAATTLSGSNATYRLPIGHYRVTVSATNGAVWTVFRMGSANTLEWQGTVSQGSSESLVLSGIGRITLGAPHNATVRVGLSAVALPTALPSTLTLILQPPATSPG